MNLTSWLEALAASYPNFQMTKLQVFEYKQELSTWMTMTDDQWIEIKSLARRRHTFFPTIAEIEEIMHEVKRQTEAAKKNGTPVWETFQGADGRVYVRRPIKKAG